MPEAIGGPRGGAARPRRGRGAGRAARRRRRASVRGAARRAQRRRALRPDGGRVRRHRAQPARVRAPGPRRGRRRRPLARGLQRPAPVAAARRRARGERAVPRRPGHRARLDPARRSASSSRARGSRPRSARGRRSPTRSPGARRPARSPSRGAGGGSCGRTPRTARSRCACPTRSRRSRTPARGRALVHALVAWLAERHDAGEPLADGRHLAARGEPLVALPAGAWTPSSPTSRPASAAPARDVPATRCWASSSRSRRGSAAAPSWPRSSRSAARQRRRPPARASRPPAGCAAIAEWLADAYVPERGRTRCAGDGVARRGVLALPQPARRHHRGAARRAARRAARACRRSRSPAGATRSPTRTSSSRSTAATSCTTAACRAWTSAGSGRRRCSRCGAALEARVRGRPARRGRAGRPPPRTRATMDLALRAIADADDGPSLSRHVERDGHARAGARVPGAPLRLPAQGGRPALVGAPAAERAAEGGARRDPGRRVRRRPARARSTRSCSPTRWRRSGSTRRYGAYVDRAAGRRRWRP